MKALAYIAALVLCGTAMAEGDVQVSVNVDPQEIPFHRQSAFTITVEAPADVDIRLPEMVDKFGGLNVYGVPKRDVEGLKGNRQRITETYKLDPIFIGYYPIEPVEVSVGESEKIRVASPGIRVRDLTEEETIAAEYFEDIAGPIEVRMALAKKWWFWCGLAVLVIAVAALLVVFYRRRGGKEKEEIRATAWEIAYNRLRRLDEQQLIKSNDYEQYYVQLSSILRYYIEDRFELRAPEETTPEFLGEAAQSGRVSQEHQVLLAGFLRHSDRVKFARYTPKIEQMETSMSQVLQFVDETVPRDEADEQYDTGAAA